MNVEKLRALWDAHAKAIHAYLLQLTRSQADASDMLQDIFCRLARQSELLAGLPEDPRGFLLRLARNLGIDHLRRLQARDRAYEKVRAGSDGDTIEAEDPDNPLLKQALADALQLLPQEQRDIVHDRLWKRRTLDEIAVARGISINTAASRYRYGLDKMREHLRPLYADFSTKPLPTPDRAMKSNPQDPIIRPLEQRRVPSATGAFALPVLPAPEEVAELSPEDIEAPIDGDVEIEIIDVPAEGEEVELPLTFDEAIEDMAGEGEFVEEADLDVVWAYQEIFTPGGEVHEDGSIEQGQEGDGSVTDGGDDTGHETNHDGEVADGSSSADGTSSIGTEIKGGSIFVLNNVSGASGGFVTSLGSSLQGNTLSVASTTSAGDSVGQVTEVPAGADSGGSDHDSPTPVGDDIAAPGSAAAEVQPTQDSAHEHELVDLGLAAVDARHEIIQPVTPSILAAPVAAPAFHPEASHLAAPIEGADHGFEIQGDHDSVISGGFTSSDSEPLVSVTGEEMLDQWVPLPVLSADHASIDLPAQFVLTDLDHQPAASHMEPDPDAGATNHSAIQDGALAMALTGAVVTARDTKPGEKKPVRNILAVIIAFFSLLTSGMAADAGDSVQPKINRIRGRVVTVTVPAGFDSVSLQKVRVIRRPANRTERVWGTLDTRFPGAHDTTLTFRLTTLTPRRNLRVIGSRSTPLPENFLSGVTTFGADSLGLSTNTSGGAVSRVSDGSVTTGTTLTLSTTAVTNSFTTDSTSLSNSGGTPATVVESDIWKIDGDRLYYFNQLRGLQVIDLTNPDDPGLLGTLRMPAAGDDLYVVDENHVALLKRSNNWWGGIVFLNGIIRSPLITTVSLNTTVAFNTTTSIASGSLTLSSTASLAPQTTLASYNEAVRDNELIIADVSAGAPEQVASVPFTGTLRESRLVGHVLYVATSVSRTSDAGSYEYGTEVTAFDLSDPAHPAKRDSVFISGWTSMVTATPDYFIVTNGWPSVLQLVDISAGDGTLKLAGTVSPEGSVADKFKIDIDGNVLTVISQAWTPWTLNEGGWTGGGLQTVLQTFSLADPAAPAALGRLEIAPGETLRATRFDSGRVYVVTFEMINYLPRDPLHVVDLSDPANPTISGAVEMPGFSTYIEPLGDRLVSIGLVDWQPTVSLFDVSDPAAPVVLQQLKLGGSNSGWSSSEAVWNEKAFKVLPQHNLILLPISGFDRLADDQWGGEWFSRVQLIDLKRDSLAARGVIDAGFSPRRADIVHANRIAAISPSKLVVVNAGNRDEPFVTAEVELAWRVDRVFRVGDYLLEIGGSADWTGTSAHTLAVAPTSDPDAISTIIDLDPLDVVGATLHDGALYLAQRAWPRWWINDDAEEKAQLLVTAYDVSALPALKKLSQASGPAPVDYWSQLTPLWPSPGTLVWSAYGNYFSRQLVIVGASSLIAGDGGCVWWGGYTHQFISFNVGTPSKIAYASTVELKPANASQLSVPFAQAGLVFISEQQLWDTDLSDDTSDAGKHFLRVIDYTEPAVPFIRDERVNIPGRLAGVAREGKLLYTVGCDLDITTGVAKDTAALHASAFDGAAAHLVATQPLPDVWSPLALSGPNVLFLDQQPSQVWKPYVPEVEEKPAGDDAGATLTVALYRPYYYWWGSYEENPLHSSLHIVMLTDAGSFTELGSLELAHDSSLHLFGDLAVTQPDYRAIRAIDISNTLAPADLGAFSLPGNVWPNLDAADGALGVGLWIPAGAYGVETLGLGK